MVLGERHGRGLRRAWHARSGAPGRGGASSPPTSRAGEAQPRATCRGDRSGDRGADTGSLCDEPGPGQPGDLPPVQGRSPGSHRHLRGRGGYESAGSHYRLGASGRERALRRAAALGPGRNLPPTHGSRGLRQRPTAGVHRAQRDQPQRRECLPPELPRLPDGDPPDLLVQRDRAPVERLREPHR